MRGPDPDGLLIHVTAATREELEAKVAARRTQRYKPLGPPTHQPRKEYRHGKGRYVIEESWSQTMGR